MPPALGLEHPRSRLRPAHSQAASFLSRKAGPGWKPNPSERRRCLTSGAVKKREPWGALLASASTSLLLCLLLPPSHAQAHTERHTCTHRHTSHHTPTHTGATTQPRTHGHTHECTHAHTCTHACTQGHTCAHAHMVTDAHTCTHGHTSTHICMHAHVGTHRCTQRSDKAHTCTHMCAHRSHKHTHLHTHTRAHAAHTDFIVHLIQEQTRRLLSLELSSRYGNDPLLSLNSPEHWEASTKDGRRGTSVHEASLAPC